jgi:hypothetical protein
MPILRNTIGSKWQHSGSGGRVARHEQFAQELAKGKAADDAYQAVGYKPDRGHASRHRGASGSRPRSSGCDSDLNRPMLVSAQYAREVP